MKVPKLVVGYFIGLFGFWLIMALLARMRGTKITPQMIHFAVWVLSPIVILLNLLFPPMRKRVKRPVLVREHFDCPSQHEHIDHLTARAHLHIAQHGIEPYRSQSHDWLTRRGINPQDKAN